MSKLTKPQIKAHRKAVDLLAQDVLSEDDREFVIENWMESAEHINSAAGAFFTPLELARNFAIEVDGGRVIDLCAGIGALSYAVAEHNNRRGVQIVCVEINPAYVEVGRKLVPHATWIVGDALTAHEMGLGRFDFAISNPPYGAVPRERSAPRYHGKNFEYHVIDAAAQMARFGVFIIPQMSAGFRYSGEPCFTREHDGRARDFEKITGLELGASCGIDCSFAKGLWRGVAPTVEIVCVDFEGSQIEAATAPAPDQLDMFGEAA